MAQHDEREEGENMNEIDDLKRRVSDLEHRLGFDERRLTEYESVLEIIGTEIGSAVGHFKRIQEEILNWRKGKRTT